MKSEFLTRLIDWKEFELFVSDLYKEDAEVIVQHNVTEVGKSGARRQIDVKVTHKSKLHTFVTLIECKSWKHSVDRARIDVFVNSVEDLNANKGVIFTTKGYQEGAIEYAKFKNIDIFIVRDLSENDWGQPGRNVFFWLQFYNATFENFQLPDTKLIKLTESCPTDFRLDITISKDMPYDENLILYSKINGQKGKHLYEFLLSIRNKVLKGLSEQINLIKSDDDGKQGQLAIVTKVLIDFGEYEFIQLRYPFGVIILDKMIFELHSVVDQDIFEFDRAAELDFALVVENYITKQRNVVSKVKTFESLKVSEELKDVTLEDDSDVLKNGSLIKIFLEAWVSSDIKPKTKSISTNDVILKPK